MDKRDVSTTRTRAEVENAHARLYPITALQTAWSIHEDLEKLTSDEARAIAERLIELYEQWDKPEETQQWRDRQRKRIQAQKKHSKYMEAYNYQENQDAKLAI